MKTIFLNFRVLVYGLAACSAFVGAQLKKSSDIRPSFAQTVVIEFANPPTENDLKNVSVAAGVSPTRFDGFDSDYFRRTYQLTFSGDFESLKRRLAPMNVKNVELVQAATLSSLVPSSVKGTDPLSNYQWALSNDGQKILREIDDIHSETVVADPKGASVDVGLAGVRARLDKELKRDIIVAVVDSGLDVDHEDIKNNIRVNAVECDGGRIPFKATADKDGNGYSGDCMGWNFTTKDDAGNNDVSDDLGHGTHVAGIIAAEVGNGIGVAGVSNHLKILPIKVTSTHDRSVSMTNRAAKAILYAIKMKADVINFSLGWPLSADAEFLRQSFAEARKAGITIVAAAGNNTSAAPVFPCSYEGVICVGAVTISGEVANFSNYGGQVDVMAPGEEILSLFPKSMEPDLFSVKGYEIKNGTSQASPFVAASAAVIKGLIPGITPDELQARLAVSTKGVKWGEKFALGGITDMSAALAAKPQPVVRPIFKSVYQVPYTMQDRVFSLKLPIKNYWQTAGDVKIDISLDSASLALDQSHFEFSSIATGEAKSVSISGRILKTDIRREVRLKVAITAAGQTKNYQQQIVLTRQLENDPDVKTFAISLRNPRATLNLSSVRSLTDSDPFPDYVLAEPANDAGLQLKLIRWKNGSFAEEAPILLPQAKGVLFAMRVDLNYDGISDYLIASVGQTGDNKFIQFTYLNQDLQPLFGRQADLRVQVEGAVIDEGALKLLTFISAKTPYGTIAMPMFQTMGGLPKEDLNPDPFAFETNTKLERLYYYEPRQVAGVWTLATRVYDNAAWLTKIREKLALPFRQDLAVSTILPQTPGDLVAGRVRALVRIGASSLKSYQTIAITGTAQADARDFSISPSKFSGQTFELADVHSAISLKAPVPVTNAQATLASVYTGTLARVTTLSEDASRVEASQDVSPERAQDKLLAFVQSYVGQNELVTFFQSKSQLIMRATIDGKTTQAQEPIDRSSLLPTQTFNAMFFPITIGEANHLKRPAIYIDSTQLFANQVYLWTVVDGELIAPMHLNVRIPNGCRPLAPRRFGSSGETAYVFMCETGTGDAKSYSLKTLNVE